VRQDSVATAAAVAAVAKLSPTTNTMS
jgi:hypothetical protein